MPLTREQILAIDDRKTVEVAVPEWGDGVLVSVMSGTERESFEREWTASDEKLLPQYKVKLLRRCLVDADHKPLFSDADLGALGEKNALVIDRLFTECMKLNGFQKDAVEEAAKN
jgi:hypothetical protein